MSKQNEYVSLAELKLLEDVLYGFNPEANANEQGLLPAGIYPMEIRRIPGQEWTRATTKHLPYIPYATLKVMGSVTSGTYQRHVFPVQISTLDVGKIESSVRKLVIALGLGSSLPKTKNAVTSLIRLIDGTLKSPCRCFAEVEWEVYVPADPVKGQMELKRSGMKGFPRNSDGSYNPEIELRNGETVMARNVVKVWLCKAILVSTGCLCRV